MELVLYFMAGMFLFNSLPHLISGVMGNKHMTPFAKDSTAMVNVLWGFTNILGGLLLLSQTSTGFQLPQSLEGMASFMAGGFALSIMAAALFSSPNGRMPWWKK